MTRHDNSCVRPIVMSFAVCVLLLVNGLLMSPGSIRAAEPNAKATVVCSQETSPMETLAAREIRRYFFQRTGELLPLVTGKPPLQFSQNAIVVGRKDRDHVGAVLQDENLRAAVASLQAQQYILKTIPLDGRRVLLVAGGDEVGTLYGAYRLAECLGVRFYLHGDVIPDEPMRFELPQLDEQGKPLFGLRGLNPWGTHAFGIDWWTTEDYKAHITQLAKMRMNFIGFHCYPDYSGIVLPEPTVWIGLKGDFDDQGRVKVSYPTRLTHTMESVPAWAWGDPMKTSDYHLGAAMLFDRDDAGSEAMAEGASQANPVEAQNAVFNHCGAMYREAFGLARALGVKTCIGTEVPSRKYPHAMPTVLVERIQAQKKDPTDPAVVQEVYEAMFQRIMKTHPLDYYWLWTLEDWRTGNTPEELKTTVEHFDRAYKAIQRVGAPFKLATAGWVLGPQEDRAAYDQLLPKDVAVSSINTELGFDPVEPGYARIHGREKWAIPWLEDDLALANPQLWVGRIRKDAADALAYNCTGLFGIHWRTQIIAPNFAALAQAGWSQTPWNPEPGKVPASVFQSPADYGPRGGKLAGTRDVWELPGREIAGTDEPTIYQTAHVCLSSYRFRVPAGKYRVTLKFCEPDEDAVGGRVFDVALQGKTVIEDLDIFAKVGKFAALDFTFDDVEVVDGRLIMTFKDHLSYYKDGTLISGIVIEGKEATLKINCGGPRYKDYVSDFTAHTMGEPRGLSTADFYADWARANFGREAAAEVAAIFERIDGNLPRVASQCPCGVKANKRTWSQVVKEYWFVDALQECRKKVKGAGNLARFDYWLNSFRYLRATGGMECAMGQFIIAKIQVEAEEDPVKRMQLAKTLAVPAYREVIRRYCKALGLLLQTTNSAGELATVAIWQQRFYSGDIGNIGRWGMGTMLSNLLGEPLTDDLLPPKQYQGQARLIVPTIRSTAAEGEKLTVSAIVLSKNPARAARLHWRPMGMGEYTVADLQHLARGVYSAALPPLPAEGIEYFIEATTEDGRQLAFPPTAPRLNQTVVALPAERPI